jgi:leader peptidase (prepilin peptidase)/N-methyltransferase
MESGLMAMYAGFAAVFGLVFGSFLNVLIARWPEDASLLPPSHCPSCGHTIRWIDLVPVLSWAWLRGRCRDCGTAISPTYPLVELLGGLLGWLLFQRFFTGVEDLDLAHVAAWVVYFTFACIVVVMATVDLRHHIIPDQTSSYAIPVGLLGTVLLGVVGFDGWPAVTWTQSVLGALVGGAFLGGVALAWRWLRGEDAMGLGDAKVLAMIGAFLGALPGVWVVLLFGSLMGAVAHLFALVIRRRRTYLPFGPFLGVAALVHLLYGDVLIPLFLPGLGAIMGL